MKMRKKIIILIIVIVTIFGYKISNTKADDLNYKYYIENLGSIVERDTNYKVRGWVMSEYKDRVVKIYIDNKEIEIESEKRNDVINAIKGYGTAETNSTPGYIGYIDTTKLSAGSHEYKLEIRDSKSNSILATQKKNFKIESYKYTGWIENLSNTVEKSSKYKIRGWVMSTSKDKTIKAYVDKEEITISNENRPDVLSAIKGFGDEKSNPTPGYIGYIDTTKLITGSHEFKLEIIDKSSNEIIGEVKKSFEVGGYKYKTWIENLSTKIKKSSNSQIRGWVMSPIKNKTIEVYIDGNKEDNLQLEKRDDVINAISNYGDLEQNPTPGFKVTFDSTKLKAGNHKITLKIIDNITGDIIGTEEGNFEVEKYKYTGWIQNQNVGIEKSNQAKIKGWVMSDSKDKSLEVWIDNTKETEIIYNKREDVIDAITGYGGIELNATPGFELTFDSTKYSVGNHKIAVKVIDNVTKEEIGTIGGIICIKKYDYTGWIETPKESSNFKKELSIRGWVMSPAIDKSVKAYVDNTEVSLQSEERPDVISAIKGYGNEIENPTPGFKATYDTTGLKDGTHVFKLVTIDNKTNDIIKTETRNFNIKKYDGMIYLENFTNSLFTKEINVRGWEMSELDGSYVKTYVDTTALPATITREERQDVINAYGSKYGDKTLNATPGFNINMSLGTVGQGVHTFKVVLYSKLGEEICTYSKKIMVYKNLTLGIDVSQFNNTINWTKVKNDSINFAFIRLGYRGYGTGKLVTDTQFVKNMTNATNAGVKAGVYFFSQAVNAAEGKEEADYTIDTIQSNKLTAYNKLPIVIDTEYSTSPSRTGRADNISKQQRTAAIKAFVDRVKQRGYTPMIYASSSWLGDKLDMSQLGDTKIWLAHWTYSIETRPSYTGIYKAWQYTNSGSINGISGDVDRDVSFISY